MNNEQSQQKQISGNRPVNKSPFKIILFVGAIIIVFSLGFVGLRYAVTKSAVRENKLELYMNRMHCKGIVVNNLFTCKVEDMEFDYNNLAIDVAFYNVHHEGEYLTVEILEEELNNFIAGNKDYKYLDEFCQYGNGDEEPDGSLLAAHDKYVYDVGGYLIDEYNVYVNEATTSQLQEAINAVNNGWTVRR